MEVVEIIKPKRQKRGGRQKGTPNKVTADLRKLAKDLSEKILVNADEYLAKMDPKDIMAFAEKMMKYCVPTLQSIQSDTSITGEIKSLSDAQVSSLFEKIINQVK